MKKYIFLLTIVFALSVSFTSCKKDTERESKFTLNNTDHFTDHGYTIFLGTSGTQSIHYVLLCSPEADFSVSDGLHGYGDLVYLLLLSDDVTGLISGNYSQADETMNAQLFISYDEDLSDAMIYSLESGGSTDVTLTISGDIFEIEYSLDLSTGSTATGYYKGTLEELSLPAKSLPVNLPELPISGNR